MELEQTGIPGCYLVKPRSFGDSRGRLTKTFHVDQFREVGLPVEWPEEYVSTSIAGAVRGMHFQVPPAAHAKLVFCTFGQIVDVVVDLRRGSPTFGAHRSFTLTGLDTGIYVPIGCAHGFVAQQDGTTVLYRGTTIYSPEHEGGIAWNSFGFNWPVADPIVSEKDQQQPGLADFDSPFVYQS
jgi:dTDP-4-dehydrorhamnose 3,5-epimerase